MPLANTPHRWGWIAMALHWVLAVLVLGLTGFGLWMTGLEDGLEKFRLYQLHKSLGVVVFVLVLTRLGWRLANPTPPLPGHLRPWERAAARFTHAGLYVLLLAQPLVGWVMSSASPLGIPTEVFGVLPLPDPVAPNEALYDVLAWVHFGVAMTILALVALHVAAALKHHFVLKDDVLKRMLPFTRVPTPGREGGNP